MKEKSKVGKLVAIAVLSFLLLCSLVGNIVSSASQKNVNYDDYTKQLINTIQERNLMLEQKDGELEKVKSEKEKAETEKKDLEKEQESWKTEKETLQEEKKKLEDEKSKLEKEKENLNSEIDKLKKVSSTQKSNNTSVVQKSSNNEQASKNVNASDSTSSEIVYITKTGAKYHRGGCSYLRNSKIQTTLGNAKSKGYTACSKCY